MSKSKNKIDKTVFSCRFHSAMVCVLNEKKKEEKSICTHRTREKVLSIYAFDAMQFKIDENENIEARMHCFPNGQLYICRVIWI